MSLQKIGQLIFEIENEHNLTVKTGGKYMYDRPVGVVRYLQPNNENPNTIESINTFEMLFSLEYTPKKLYFQNRERRVPVNPGKIELKLKHRIGMKGIVGSDYNYHITNLSAYKRFDFGHHIGNLDLRLSAGKVWNRVPFPLLFIPLGNQSYIYMSEGFNRINFYEFITDQFVSGNAGFTLNWSPFKLLNPNSKIKTSLGVRSIFGPLSDNNNPELHPELFMLNQGIKPLGNTPYTELNIGLANILKILRIEYVHRLNYLNDSQNKNNFWKSILFSGSFSF